MIFVILSNVIIRSKFNISIHETTIFMFLFIYFTLDFLDDTFQSGCFLMYLGFSQIQTDNIHLSNETTCRKI